MWKCGVNRERCEGEMECFRRIIYEYLRVSHRLVGKSYQVNNFVAAPYQQTLSFTTRLTHLTILQPCKTVITHSIAVTSQHLISSSPRDSFPHLVILISVTSIIRQPSPSLPSLPRCMVQYLCVSIQIMLALFQRKRCGASCVFAPHHRFQAMTRCIRTAAVLSPSALSMCPRTRPLRNMD